jgi:hypothetical protein
MAGIGTEHLGRRQLLEQRRERGRRAPDAPAGVRARCALGAPSTTA